MAVPDPEDRIESRALDGVFPATQWSVVLAAVGTGSRPAAGALDALCAAYWLPLYAYVRRAGHSPADAEDLTQQFFARLLSGDGLKTADPARGRFRTFLLTSMQRFLVSEWRRGQALKRGEGRIVALDPAHAEELLATHAACGSPEREFDRRWADALLQRALDRLRCEMDADGKGPVFDHLKGQIWGAGEPATAQVLAAGLGLTEGAVRVAAHRLRKRFRELLRAEVAATVGSESDVDDELRHLAGLLAA